MPHVDDGTLHAWLDGALDPSSPEGEGIRAHLAACEECRRRLEAEREIRDRAGTLLDDAAPDVDLPPFEEVRRRAGAAAGGDEGDAGGTGGGGGPGLRTRTLVAWAASVVVALAVGRYAELPGPGRSPVRQGAPPGEEVAAPAAGEGAEAPEELAREGDTSGTPDAATRRREAVRPATPVLEDAAGPPARAEALARAPAKAEVDAASDDAAADEESRGAPTTSGTAPLLPNPGRLPPGAEAVVADLGGARWTAVSEAEAGARLGGDVLAPPDREPVGIAVSGIAGTTVVRSQYALAPGRVLEVYQWSPAPRGSGEADLAGDAGAVSEPAGGPPAPAGALADDRRPGGESRALALEDRAVRLRRTAVETGSAAWSLAGVLVLSDEEGGSVALLQTGSGELVLARAPVPPDSLRALLGRSR